MPGFDRTGPMGQGRRTGHGLGRCNGRGRGRERDQDGVVTKEGALRDLASTVQRLQRENEELRARIAELESETADPRAQTRPR